MKEDKNPSGVNAAAPETETELEAFRQKWREEVSARNKKPDSSSPQTSVEVSGHRRKEDITASTPIPGPSVTRRNERFHEALEPRSYHDLPDKEDQHKLGTEEAEVSRAMYKEPTTALEHYEKAVEKETQGILGESMKHYRRAFKVRFPFLSIVVAVC
jgi:F-box protein 9